MFVSSHLYSHSSLQGIAFLSSCLFRLLDTWWSNKDYAIWVGSSESVYLISDGSFQMCFLSVLGAHSYSSNIMKLFYFIIVYVEWSKDQKNFLIGISKLLYFYQLLFFFCL